MGWSTWLRAGLRGALQRAREPGPDQAAVGPGRAAVGEAEPPTEPTRPTEPTEPTAPAVPWSLQVAAAWSWRLIVVGAVGVGLFWLAARFMLVVAPLMIGLLLASLLMPAQRALLRASVNRSLAALLVVVGGIAAVGGTLYLVVRQFVAGFDALVDNVERGIEQVEEWLLGGVPDPTASPTPQPTPSPTPDPPGTPGLQPAPTGSPTPAPADEEAADGDQLLANLPRMLQDWADQNQEQLTTAGLAALLGTVQFLTGMVLALVVTFFFLRDGGRIWTFLVGLLPAPAQAPLAYAGDGAWRSLSGYLRATVLVALVDAIGVGVGLWVLSLVMHFPRGLVLPVAALVFLSGFVPIVGAFVSGTVAVLVGLVTGLEAGPAYGLAQALIVLGIVVFVQQLASNVLQPLVVRRVGRIHPLAVIIAVMAGIMLAGLIGALVAVPAVTVLDSVIRRLNRYRRRATPPAAGEPASG